MTFPNNINEDSNIMIQGYRCLRCGHEWVPRGQDNPVVCPKCKSPYWNKPKTK